MFFKTIIQGRLDFGSEKSYEKVAKMFQYRIDTYYHNDFIFKAEEIFKPESLSMDIERFVGNVSEKSYKGTSELLSYCAQFAVNGIVRTWLIDNGEVLFFNHIEPESDKAAVQLYMKGKKLVKVSGKQDEAIEQFSRAIEKHDRHAQAYERRAKTCFLLKKFPDALRDYNKCISIDPTLPSAFYGRGRVHIINQEWDKAIEDLDLSIKRSVALETIHWKSRRLKGFCHVQTKEWDKAIFELKLFTTRKFKREDHNFEWRRFAFYYYGIALTEKEMFGEALMAFDAAAELPELKDGVDTSELLRLKAQAKQKAGKNGYIKDLKDASKLGNKKAKKQLKEFA